jgi:hypothetical protein
MMNKGSPPFYERRGGQWVQRDSNTPIQSVNEVLCIGITHNDCVHEWGPYKGPIPAIYVNPPIHYYVCHKCFTQKTSKIRLPTVFKEVPRCQHVFVNDPGLGEAYAKYEACLKCGEQRIKEKDI